MIPNTNTFTEQEWQEFEERFPAAVRFMRTTGLRHELAQAIKEVETTHCTKRHYWLTKRIQELSAIKN